MSTEKIPEEIDATPAEDQKEPVKSSLISALFGITGGQEEISPPAVEKKEEKEKDDVSPESDQKLEDNLQEKSSDEKPDKEKSESFSLSAKDIIVKKKQKQKAEKPVAIEDTPPAKKTPPEEKQKEEKKLPEVEEDLSYLSKSEIETLELIKFGESREIADKGSSKRLTEYYKKRKDLIEQLNSENLDDEEYEAEKDPKFQRWQKQNQPPFQKEKLREIYDERLISKAEERAIERMRRDQEERDRIHEENMKQIQKEQLNLKLEEEVSKFSDEVLSLMPEEITKAMRAGKDWEAIESEFPIEAPIVKSTINEYSDKAEALISLMDGITEFNQSSPIHSELRNFINKQANYFLKKGEEVTTRNGLKFLPPEEYLKNPEGAWTFSRDQIIKMMKKDAQIQANKRIEQDKKRFDHYINKAKGSSPDQNGESPKENDSPSVKSPPSSIPNKDGKPKKKLLFDMF